MARNRKSRKHRRGRRGRGGIVYRILCVVVILLALVVGSAVFFRVDEVTVNGNSHYTYDEIVAASGVRQGENLFVINKYQVAEQMLEQLPYVSSVAISRSLPDTLVVTVTESSAAAWVETPAGNAVINSSGKVMELGPSDTGAQVTGLAGAQGEVGKKLTVEEELGPRFDSLTALMQTLESQELLGKVHSFDLSSASALKVTYQDTITARFPYTTDYAYHVRAFLAAMDYTTAGVETTIDLTYEDGVHIFSE